MENQNPQTPQPQAPTPEAHNVAFPDPAASVQPQPTAPTIPVNPVPQTPTPERKGFKGFGGLLEKYKSAPKNIKLLITVGLVFFVLIVLLSIAALIKNMSGGAEKAVAPIATPTAAPSVPLTEVQISNPSRYATDSGVLKIESDVDSLSKEMDGVDLRQSNLRVPTLDFNIKFQ